MGNTNRTNVLQTFLAYGVGTALINLIIKRWYWRLINVNSEISYLYSELEISDRTQSAKKL